MNIYWGSAISMLFFMGTGYLAARYFNFEGPLWYTFLSIMGALGITSSAFFYFFQDKLQNRKQAKAGAAAAGGAAAPVKAGNEAQQWVKEANAKLAQSKPGVGI